MERQYFRTAAEFREWLAENHATASEIGVVLHSKGSGKPTMTWSEAVDQALCFGWIDSIARRLDETSRVQRFTPRRPKSNWSAVNIKKVAELTAAGLMMPAGLAAFARREEARSQVYSYENRHLATLGSGARGGLPLGSESVGVFQQAGAVIPADVDLLGHEREERGDAHEPAGAADRDVGPGPPPFLTKRARRLTAASRWR